MGRITLDAALENFHATAAAHEQSARDLMAAIEIAMQAPQVERKLDFARILASLRPIRERGLTETTRPALNTAMEIARNATGG
jgi:hypothetical protein